MPVIGNFRQLGHCKFMGICRVVYGVGRCRGMDREYWDQMELGSISYGGFGRLDGNGLGLSGLDGVGEGVSVVRDWEL